MSFDFSTLETHIHKILTSPGTDFSKISAKAVRRQLVDSAPELSPDFVKENRDQVNQVITKVYTSLSGELARRAEEVRISQNAEAAATDENGGAALAEGCSETSETRKRKPESAEESTAENDVVVNEERTAKKARKDAGNNVTAPRKVGRPKKNSAETVESEGASRRKRTEKKAAGAKGGFATEYTLSDPLAQIIGVERLSRPQVVKQLWDYIKKNQLQNPDNRKEILLDDKMKAVFGGDKIDMFMMNKALGKHLTKE